MRKGTLLKWLLGVGVLLALIYIVETTAGWQATVEQWQHIDPLIIMSGFGLFAASHLLRAGRIYAYLFYYQGRYLCVCKISALHQFANNLLPMRLGEFAFPLLIRQTYGTQLADGLGQLVWLRLLDLAFMGAIVAGTLFFILPLSIYIALAGIAMLGMVALAFLFPLIEKRVSFIAKASHTLKTNRPKSAPLTLVLFSFTVAAWAAKVTALAIIITGLSSLPLVTAIMGTLGAEISGLLPVHGVAGSGSFEAAFIAGAALHTSTDISLLSLAVNVHIFVLLSTSLVTVLLLPVSLVKERLRQTNIKE